MSKTLLGLRCASRRRSADMLNGPYDQIFFEPERVIGFFILVPDFKIEFLCCHQRKIVNHDHYYHQCYECDVYKLKER